MSVGAASADLPAQRVPVSVELVGDDGLTQNLHVALEQGLRAHPHLRLADNAGEAMVTIRSETNVEWDRLDGRLVVIYRVFVGRGENEMERIGICYERRMSKCVNDILRLASIAADSL
jgi:hypothetical protein